MAEVQQQGDDVLTEREQAALLDLAHEAILVRDYTTNRIRFWNRGAALLYGWAADEALGQSSHTLLQTDFLRPLDAMIDDVLRAGRWDGELVQRTRDGTRIVVASRWALERDVHGQPVAVLEINRDVTARKAIEAELHTRLRQQAMVATLGQQALGSDGLPALLEEAVRRTADTLGVEYVKVLALEPDGARLRLQAGVGFAPALLGQATVPADANSQGGFTLLAQAPVLVHDLREETRFRPAPLLTDHGIVSGVSVVIPGTERPFGVLGAHSTVRRRFTEDDLQFLQAVVTVLALAVERDRAERATRAARDEAERANQAKSEFLSRMSHELRTPLNAILGFGQLLELEELTEDGREAVEHILKGGRHLLDLINEVLDIARIEAGRLPLSPEPLRADELVEEAVALVRPLAAQRAIRLGVEATVPCAVYVTADRQRLKQVLLNLLANAIKYNREGGTVSVLCAALPNDQLRITVQDTGPGIAPGLLERLFIPFDRLGAEATDVEGTGLGLALAQRLVEAMGGTIDVASSVGTGSTFWLDLPIVEGPLAALDRQPGDEPAVTTTAESVTPTHTVLAIEDNLSNVRLLERILTRRPGVQLLTAMQGQLGLDLAREHRPDLILLDVNLPDIPGSEVLHWLQGEPATQAIPVVVISADATPGQIERLRAGGAREYLTKPFDVARLLAVLDELLTLPPAR